MHRAFGRAEIIRINAVSGVFLGHTLLDLLNQFVVVAPTSHRIAKRRFGLREQTISQPTIGGQSQTVAIATKWTGN